MMTSATFLPRYLETLDSAPNDVVQLFAPDFTFAVLWKADHGAQEFAGGLEAFRGYLAQRDADGQRHHIFTSSRRDRTEVVVGWTTRHGERLATFTMWAEVDADDRAEKLFAARTASVQLNGER
jgi:hypothetical protein